MHWHLAQVNIARLAAPLDSPALAPFVAQLDAVNARAEAASGFHWRLVDTQAGANNATSLRPFGDDVLVNLSVWESVDALKRFVYGSPDHQAALKRRAEWFVPIKQAHLALWWVPAGHRPTLADAKRRLDSITQAGNSAFAFDFTAPFTPEQAQAPQWHVQTLLRLADNALVLAQRLSEWCGHGPALEEDIAMANISLDLIGQARLLLSHAGAIEGFSRDEDQLAYFRDGAQYLNWSLCELPNASSGDAKHEDYAITIARNLLYSAYALSLWEALAASKDTQLAAIAQKAIKETRAHWRHASDWTVRLGDGTEHSNARMQAALERLWPYTNECFADDETDREAASAGIAPLPSSLKAAWIGRVSDTLQQACLAVPKDSGFLSCGKQGRHTEYLSYLLSEMQSVARAHPGAQW